MLRTSQKLTSEMVTTRSSWTNHQETLPHSLPIKDSFAISIGTQEEHDTRLFDLLDRLFNNGLRVNPDKCIFDVPSINFDGHFISADGIRLDPTKKDAIDAIKEPKNVSEVNSLMGLFDGGASFPPLMRESALFLA